MAKTNKPNGSKVPKSSSKIDVPTLVPIAETEVSTPAQLLTTPAEYVTGLIMYANSHYYYSLDCCVTADPHTAVYVTTVAQVIYSCQDPNRQKITISGSIGENAIDGNYEFAEKYASTSSRVSPVAAAPLVSVERLATFSIAAKTANNLEAPPQLLRKAYGLFEVKYGEQSYMFLVYERPAARYEMEVALDDEPRMDGPIFIGRLSIGRDRYKVLGVVHD